MPIILERINNIFIMCLKSYNIYIILILRDDCIKLINRSFYSICIALKTAILYNKSHSKSGFRITILFSNFINKRSIYAGRTNKITIFINKLIITKRSASNSYAISSFLSNRSNRVHFSLYFQSTLICWIRFSCIGKFCCKYRYGNFQHSIYTVNRLNNLYFNITSNNLFFSSVNYNFLFFKTILTKNTLNMNFIFVNHFIFSFLS